MSDNHPAKNQFQGRRTIVSMVSGLLLLLFLLPSCASDVNKNQDITQLDKKIDATQSEVETLNKDVEKIKSRLGLGGDAEASMPPASVRQTYERAQSLLSRKDYAGAASLFKDILTRAPRDKLAPNAGYWLGECFYSQKQYRQAITQFSQVVQDYPASAKAPDATLKIAYSYHQLGEGNQAMDSLRTLLRRWPKSDSARMVRSGRTLFRYP